MKYSFEVLFLYELTCARYQVMPFIKCFNLVYSEFLSSSSMISENYSFESDPKRSPEYILN